MSGYGEGNFGEGPYGGNQPEGFDFSAFEYRIRNWAETASPEFRSAFASDCAARTLPNIFGPTPKFIDSQLPLFSFDLTLIRSIISARVSAAHASVQVKKSNAAAGLAAKTAYAKVIAESENSTPVALSTDAAAYCADAGNSAYSAASAAFTINPTTALCAESSIARLENGGLASLVPIPLWLGFPIPETTETNWTNLKAEWSTDPAMAFWIDWYEGLLAGRSPDWDLWHDIVLIEDKHWNTGPEAVAREIERIKKELRDKRASDEERAPDFEPPSVAPLQQNGFLVRAAALSMSGQIESAIDTYLNETGQNCIPATFAPLHGISHASFQIAGLVDLPKPSDEETQRLREEVGRLKAHIAQLEKGLASALAAKEAVFIPELKKKIAQSIGDWKLYGAIFGSVWLISGDELGMQKRLENLGKTRDAFFQDVDEPPKTPEPPTITFDV
jgi:hypothetical protein